MSICGTVQMIVKNLDFLLITGIQTYLLLLDIGLLNTTLNTVIGRHMNQT